MPLTIREFNEAPAQDVRPALTACLDVPRWVETLLARRPYADLAALLATAEALAPLRPEEIRRAMAAHPRIGEKADGKSTEAGWSRSEQSGVDGDAAREFAAANAEYEATFGHVFLVCASGRSGAELLENLRSRLSNDPEKELEVAGQELAEIAALRLEKAVTA
ncbi:2-oxo-4-hydroxy-4-carboxy-5-ureidoimidazoline decarboxylase [Amycolatopsis sp. WAC 04182]|uniref:2-oxo-4-hydroxy-4-carboxy-5-ureidoimidazoline decarboxylase n=1 Tax=Amycolatopsis sp. WAC 04182 TaxID=2203198 RepID=UPI000F7B5B70|nr:2-oxo-4-hydroxy-4-carboxy-5-ureidoimidazoline decarboxylase [Amycolatopsis sp. WAC 04182]RSN64984.1 2-oxo-4-hydroxy-4-carboxy-5-ureidoimidazoline decarboxylase [Amycolatopsis sp. WAC 04182]